MFRFIKNTISELRKVDWLKRKDAVRYTLIVIFFLVFGTLYILGLDEALTEVRSQLIFQNI